MSVNAEVWNQSYHKFQEQVEAFNQAITTSSLDLEEIDKIDQLVGDEVKRLKEYTTIVKAKEKALEESGCCTTTSKAMWILFLLNTACKVCSIAGSLLAIFQDDGTAKWIGFGIFCVGEGFDTVTTLHTDRIFIKGMEIAELSKLNKEGAKHAKQFKKFLEKLKEVKKLEQELIEKHRSHEEAPLSEHHTVIDLSSESLDEKISACLHNYEDLPSQLRDDDLYCRILSIVIANLPNDDPLKMQLIALEPREKDISALADKSLPIRYLSKKQSYSHSSDEEDLKLKKWKNEKISRKKESILIKTKRIDVLTSQEAYGQKVAYYKHLVAQRFNTRRMISSLYTPHGWIIDSQNDIKRAEEK